MGELRSGDAVFRTAPEGRIREWNQACEQLTGISAADAEGRECWDVIRGRDAHGGVVCHRACSIMALARQGWPVRCTDLHLETPQGTKRVTISTIVLHAEAETVVLHPLREAADPPRPRPRDLPEPHLTARQREVLQLLAEGLVVKQIAARLTLSQTTVRNHVRAIFRELDAHSQLEAVAQARLLSIVDDRAVPAPPANAATWRTGAVRRPGSRGRSAAAGAH
jgi:DNA-binding CsgD family transcriptional regulator